MLLPVFNNRRSCFLEQWFLSVKTPRYGLREDGMNAFELLQGLLRASFTDHELTQLGGLP